MKQTAGPGLKEGLVDGIPLVVGYFPVAMAFGLLAKTTGVSFVDTCLFSVMVFAGASQFMALDLIRAGVASADIILATFLLNLRHLMMSASLAVRLGEVRKGFFPLIAFGVTDESFSVASLKAGKIGAAYLLALNGITYASWAGGTAAGYLAGMILPVAVQNSLGVGLYSLFMAILAPEIKKDRSVLFLAAFSGLSYLLIRYSAVFSAGWTLIASIIVAASAGVLVLKDKDGEAEG
ncbi:MAG: AzlC family ABC transporter permease [Negativicutes bacterium]|nr:AzlC family ABC transporter permease [Negativicutes bacterium]